MSPEPHKILIRLEWKDGEETWLASRILPVINRHEATRTYDTAQAYFLHPLLLLSPTLPYSYPFLAASL
jgi:hypothetical protein